MIGKSENPHCFRNVKQKPIKYTHNQKAWMTSVLFEEWLHNLDTHFTKQKRTILLFLDNCTAHNKVPDFKSIKVIFSTEHDFCGAANGHEGD